MFRFSTQAVIIIFLTTLLTLTIGIIGYTGYMGTKTSLHKLSQNMMSEITRSVLNKTNHYFKQVDVVSVLSYHFVDKEIVSPDTLPSQRKLLPLKFIPSPSQEKMLDYFQDVLRINPQLSSIFFGDRLGNFYMVSRMPDNSISIKLITHQDKKVISEWRHQNTLYNKDFPNMVQSESDAFYDPRSRPWYIAASKTDKTIWTDIYIFFSTKRPGLTNAVSVYSKGGRIEGVLGIDVGIADLSYFLANLRIGKSGKAFLLQKAGTDMKVVAMPIQEGKSFDKIYQKIRTGNQEKIELISAEKVDDSIISSSYKAFVASKSESSDSESEEFFFYFYDNDEKYLAMYTPLYKGSSILTGIVLPERDIMAEVYQNNRKVMVFAAILFIVALIIGFFLARIISRPLKMLSQEMKKVKDFNLEASDNIPSSLIEVNAMSAYFEDMKKGLKSFEKYVPKDLVEQLIMMDKEAVLGGESRELTVFFSDIAGFTAISESLSPEQLVENLGYYFKEVGQVILQHQGTVDKYIGDAVMAFWNAPKEIKNHAIAACHASLDVQRTILKVSQYLNRHNKPGFPTRIGLNTGKSIVGNMGSERRMNYTVIGDNVNLASRVEGLNKYYGTQIIITESTYLQAKDEIEARLIDIVAVKGKTQGVAIYELVSERDNITAEMSKFIKRFEEGMGLYRNAEWEDAKRIFDELHSINPTDVPAKIILKRCADFILDPPKDWTGVTVLHEK